MRRRTIRTAKKRALVLAAITRGLNHGEAARAAGIGRRSLFEWKAADPEFAAAVDDAYATVTDKLADYAMQRALSSDGINHDTLLIFMLKARDPARFNRKQVEARVAGDQSNPITVEHRNTPPPNVRLVIVPSDCDEDSLVAAAIGGDQDDAAAD
jgi:hypothetical protein